MIAPHEPWHRFENDVEMLNYLRRIKLQPKTKAKSIYYAGPYVEEPVICDVVGYESSGFLVISVFDDLHCIHNEHLLDMQSWETVKKKRSSVIVPDLET